MTAFGMRLIVSPVAEADIIGAFAWYEDQRTGFGSEFLAEISSAVDAVIYEPLRFPVVYRSIRRALVHRFPYGLFFVVAGEEVTILAVLHLARNPRRMQRRQLPET